MTQQKLTAWTAALLLAFSTFLPAQNWHRDTSFGQSGIAWIDAMGTTDRLTASSVLPDGKVLLAYTAEDIKVASLVVLDPDGKPDTTFGNAGTTDLPDVIWSVVACQPDGKILAGSIGDDWWGQSVFRLWRFTPDGLPDSTFSEDGVADSIFADYYYQRVFKIAVLPDGRILLCGIAQENGSEQHFRLIRLFDDGSHDHSFGQDGFAGFSFPFDAYQLDQLLVQPDGKILIGGNWQTLGHRNIVVLRYLPDGQPDTNFGVNGKTNTDFSFGDDFISHLLLYPDGRILAAGGYINKSTNKDVAGMVRYLSDGTPDGAFGQSGKVKLPDNNQYGAFRTVQLLPNGQLLTVIPETTPGSSELSFWVKRFNPDGQPDDLANADTYLDDDWGVPVNSYGQYAWQPGNRLLFLSDRNNNSPLDREIAASRYQFDGTLSKVPIAPFETPEVRIGPNPGIGVAIVYILAWKPVQGILTMVDATGRPVLQRPVNVDRARPFTEPLSETVSLPAGLYLWRFTTDKGASTGGCWVRLNE